MTVLDGHPRDGPGVDLTFGRRRHPEHFDSDHRANCRRHPTSQQGLFTLSATKPTSVIDFVKARTPRVAALSFCVPLNKHLRSLVAVVHNFRLDAIMRAVRTERHKMDEEVRYGIWRHTDFPGKSASVTHARLLERDGNFFCQADTCLPQLQRPRTPYTQIR